MMTASKKAVVAVMLLAISGGATLAANAVATRPTTIHAARSEKSTVIGSIGVSQTIVAKNCRKGWCAAAGGYVRSDHFRFGAYDQSYDYNVPLALPPYGYSPGFWGYGGRRYYDKFGNYTKYGQQGYTGATSRFDTRPIESIQRKPFGLR